MINLINLQLSNSNQNIYLKYLELWGNVRICEICEINLKYIYNVLTRDILFQMYKPHIIHINTCKSHRIILW